MDVHAIDSSFRGALFLGALVVLTACGMTESRLNTLPLTPLTVRPAMPPAIDIDAVSARLIELSVSNTAEPPMSASSPLDIAPTDEALARALASKLVAEGVLIAKRAPEQHPARNPVAEERGSATVTRPQQNVSTLGSSNYSDYLHNHEPLTSLLLDFDSDSLTVSAANRRYLRSVAKAFNSDSDLVTILGCSNGPTRLRNGNALLALGRAQRVQQQLLAGGVSPEHMLTEGCWSGERRTDNLPNRGVLVTVYRKRVNES